jgi:carboxypeptidase Q
MRCVLTVLLAFVTTTVHAAPPEAEAIGRIIDEGLNHSEIAETAAYLTDRIGGRMTNSPQMRAAEKWAEARFRGYGLSNVRADGFEFGRGWSVDKFSLRMTAPRLLQLTAVPVAWTPATSGTLNAGIVVAPMEKERDLAKWHGRLAGKIVLVSYPGTGSEPDKPAFRRLAADELKKLDEYELPAHSPAAIEKVLKDAMFDQKRDAFLKAEGALAWVEISYRDAGLVSGEGYSYAVGATPALPGVQLMAEDYRRLARLAKTDAPVAVELLSDVRFHDDDHNAYNILADIPGADAKSGYVMAGAHLDSWIASDGAADNGAGSVVVLEAARILAKRNIRPKRTVRFALWAGEEQGLLGSLAYVEKYLATRAPATDSALAKIMPYYTWRNRWPITPKPGARELAAYFNIDNGSGKIRGVYAEGNPAVVPIFREWLAPFGSLGASIVSLQPTGGTDHVFMQSVGVPGFQFIQDPLDYGSRTHHSNVDSYDHLKIADLRQAAVILAAFLFDAANRAEPLPRPPVPTQPKPVDPFDYPRDE